MEQIYPIARVVIWCALDDIIDSAKRRGLASSGPPDVVKYHVERWEELELEFDALWAWMSPSERSTLDRLTSALAYRSRMMEGPAARGTDNIDAYIRTRIELETFRDRVFDANHIRVRDHLRLIEDGINDALRRVNPYKKPTSST